MFVHSLLKFKLRHSRGGTPKHTQTVIDATQKETAIDQQQHSCETLISQRHQTIIRLPRQAHGGEFANFIVLERM